MKTLPLSEAKAQLSKLVDAVASRDEQIVITRNGRPAAMLVNPDEIESWEATIEILQDPAMMAAIQRGLRDLDAGRILSDAEIEELFDLPPGEAQRGVPARVLRKRRRPIRRSKGTK
jgi:antitoxin YefM